MPEHFRKVCQYGELHAQCRCPGPIKVEIPIPCDTPDKHEPKSPENKRPAQNGLVPLNDRLSKVVDDYFGGIVNKPVRDGLVNSIEHEVKQWLSEWAKNL